jgi:hypothetical protein
LSALGSFATESVNKQLRQRANPKPAVVVANAITEVDFQSAQNAVPVPELPQPWVGLSVLPLAGAGCLSVRRRSAWAVPEFYGNPLGQCAWAVPEFYGNPSLDTPLGQCQSFMGIQVWTHGRLGRLGSARVLWESKSGHTQLCAPWAGPLGRARVLWESAVLLEDGAPKLEGEFVGTQTVKVA